jgi:hypothetical protein
MFSLQDVDKLDRDSSSIRTLAEVVWAHCDCLLNAVLLRGAGRKLTRIVRFLIANLYVLWPILELREVLEVMSLSPNDRR